MSVEYKPEPHTLRTIQRKKDSELLKIADWYKAQGELFESAYYDAVLDEMRKRGIGRFRKD